MSFLELLIWGADGPKILKYQRETFKSLDPSEQEVYRQLEYERLEKSRKKFIEKYLSPGEFEKKYGSDFEKVSVEVEKLFKVGCSRLYDITYICSLKFKSA